MKTFICACDHCGCKLIDKITNYSNYTRTVYYKRLEKFKIWFYCPTCISKFKIKTDEFNEEGFYYE